MDNYNKREMFQKITIVLDNEYSSLIENESSQFKKIIQKVKSDVYYTLRTIKEVSGREIDSFCNDLNNELTKTINSSINMRLVQKFKCQ